MLPYISDSKNRIRVIFILASSAIFTQFILYSFLENNTFSKILKYFPFVNASYIKAPTAFIIFGIFYFLYDRYLWKYDLINKTPNLSGFWVGYIIDRNELADPKSHPFNKYVPVKLDISQTFSKMSINFRSYRNYPPDWRVAYGKLIYLSHENKGDTFLNYTWERENLQGETQLTLNKKMLHGQYKSDINKGNIYLEKEVDSRFVIARIKVFEENGKKSLVTSVEDDELNQWLKYLKVEVKDFNAITEQKNTQQGSKYCSTILNPQEFAEANCDLEWLKLWENKNIWLEIRGISKIEKANEIFYFLSVKSIVHDKIREEKNLTPENHFVFLGGTSYCDFKSIKVDKLSIKCKFNSL